MTLSNHVLAIVTTTVITLTLLQTGYLILNM